MRKFARDEVKDVYREYIEHLREAHPLEYEQYERYFTKYAL